MASNEPNGIYFSKKEFAEVFERSKPEVLPRFVGQTKKKIVQETIKNVLALKYQKIVVNWDSDGNEKEMEKLVLNFNRLMDLLKYNLKPKDSSHQKVISNEDFLSPDIYPSIFSSVPVKLKPGYFKKYFDSEER